MAAHSGDTKEFGELTYAQQASSISAALNNVAAAIEHHADHSPHGRAETGAKCIAQVERLLGRLRASFAATSRPPADDCEKGKWYIIGSQLDPDKPASRRGPFDTEREATIVNDSTMGKQLGAYVWQCPED